MSEIYTKISELCTSKDISVSHLCKEIGIGRSVLSELKSGRSRNLSLKNIALISHFFGVPKDFLNGTGVFSNWRAIMDNIDDVFGQLRYQIPHDFLLHEDDEYYLYAYLDSKFYYGNDLPLFLNWLFESVKEIKITENDTISELDYGIPPVAVSIVFREKLQELIDKHIAEKEAHPRAMRAISMKEAMRDFISRHQINTSEADSSAVHPDRNTLQLVGRDGRRIERNLSDEQMRMLCSLIAQLPDAPEDL